ncbi:MAG: toxin [Candidatus Pacebacteria bacterium]|nr:toxin [Candidatus Paceibacterota bacterium]
MRKFADWDEEKNQWLKVNRSISFEEVLIAMDNGQVLDIIENKNYPNQRMLIINFENYAFIVPYVEDKEKLFFKTIYPSRKYTKLYLEKGDK